MPISMAAVSTFIKIYSIFLVLIIATFMPILAIKCWRTTPGGMPEWNGVEGFKHMVNVSETGQLAEVIKGDTCHVQEENHCVREICRHDDKNVNVGGTCRRSAFCDSEGRKMTDEWCQKQGATYSCEVCNEDNCNAWPPPETTTTETTTTTTTTTPDLP